MWFSFECFTRETVGLFAAKAPKRKAVESTADDSAAAAAPKSGKRAKLITEEEETKGR